MMKLKFIYFTLVAFFITSISFSQEDTTDEKKEGGSLEELSKQIANPLAQIWNLSFQQNFLNWKIYVWQFL